MGLLAELVLVRRSRNDAKVREGGKLEDKPSYGNERRNWAMFEENTRLAWHRCFAGCIDLKVVFMPEKQDALTKPASPITGAAITEVVVCAERLSLSLVMSSERLD